eukprot:CAMPEP_0169152132 /NCGR_PEP_ID=MMETSP1015-20121227/51299_1 /TAXON_ID=342587 /ORGANISM="Karlodinium micrum, Strain CCMP2283" /LENGTH=36 /DNA_ID= /DNA_START= /DNA_END= /DNA_ORIENTATION=
MRDSIALIMVSLPSSKRPSTAGCDPSEGRNAGDKFN